MSHAIQEPVIKKALGKHWEQLDRLVQRHYDISPGTSSKMVIEGVMSEVYHSNIAKLFLLPGRLFGALVLYRGRDVPTRVVNRTRTDDRDAMYWHRTFHFSGQNPVVFGSRMVHTRGNEIIEFVRYGMGIRMSLSVQDAALVYKSLGYVWRIGALSIPIPGWALLGNAVIVEKAISDDAFEIEFVIRHPLLGKTFSYEGIFSITESDSEDLQ